MDIASRRIVITGATGLIGSQVARALAERGDRVTALVRSPEAARTGLRFAHDPIQWSSSSAGGPWADAVARADAVVNLAGAPIAGRWSAAHKQRALATRIDATHNLIQAMRQAQHVPRVLVNASAVGFYGTSETATFTEMSAHGSDFLAQVCHAWEQEAHTARALGTRVAIVRIGIVLDAHGGALAKLLPFHRMFVGGPVAPGGQWFPWVHVQDVVRMIIWALDDANVEGPVNAVAPGITTNRAFSKTLGRVLHRPEICTVPRFVVRLMLGEGAYILTEGQHVIPDRACALGYRFAFPDLEPALQNLLE